MNSRPVGPPPMILFITCTTSYCGSVREMAGAPTVRFVCTEFGRPTKETFEAPGVGGSSIAGFGTPAFFHPPSLDSRSARASSSETSPLMARAA
jgi:hypothetical protein